MIFPRTPYFGRLELVEVYEFYDRPVLLSCHNSVGTIFLVILVKETSEGDSWLYVPMTEDRFRQVRSGGIDLYTACRDSEEGVAYHVTIPKTGAPESIEPLEAGSVSPSLLPMPGESIELPTDTLPRFSKTLSLEAARTRRDLLTLSFEFPDSHRNEAPAKFLGQALTAVQDAISAIAQSLEGTAGRRGSLARRSLAASELEVVAVAGGSFEIKLASRESADLFNNTPATKAIAEFLGLLRLGSQAEPLQERLRKLQARAAANYLALLRTFDKHIDSARVAWAKPGREAEVSATLSAVTVQAAIAVIEFEGFESRKEETLLGRLTGASITKMTFELSTGTKKTDEVSGDIADEAVESVKGAVIDHVYRARIERIERIKIATGEVIEKATLLELVPINRPAGN